MTMNEELISQIEDLGLSNKEARVYVANLILGPAGVQQIADTSGIKRVTTYVILESLVNLGLVSQTTKAKKTLFNAESPENLQRLLDKKEESLKDQKQQLKELLPELDSLKTLPKDTPHVKFYDGVEGIKTINQMFFTELKKSGITESYGISNLDDLSKYLPEIEDRRGNPARLEAGIKSKFIYTSQKGAIMKESDKEKNRESRYLPPEKFNFSCDLSIAGKYLALLSTSGSQPIGVVIESLPIASGMKSIFDLAWEASEKYQ